MQDGLASENMWMSSGTCTTIFTTQGTQSGGNLAIAADQVNKTEVGNEIPFTTMSGTQQMIKTGLSKLTSGEANVTFPLPAYSAAPYVFAQQVDTGSRALISVMSYSAGSFQVSGTGGDAAGSFVWLAIGDI